MKELTAKQREALILVMDGLTYEEMGAKMGVHWSTAKAHTTAVRRALGVEKKRELIAAGRAYLAEEAA